MNLKKITPVLAAAALTAASAFTAFGAQSSYPVCPVNGCNLAEAHQHDGCTYAGHTWGDGHDYHPYCSASGCTVSGVHSHNGETCYGYHRSGSGHHSSSHGRHCR